MTISEIQAKQSTYFSLGIALSFTVVVSTIAIACFTALGDSHLLSYWKGLQNLKVSLLEIAGATLLISSALHFLHAASSSYEMKIALRILQIVAFLGILGVTSYQIFLNSSLWSLPIVGAATFLFSSLFWSSLTKLPVEDTPAITAEQETAREVTNPSENKIAIMAAILNISSPLGVD